MGRSKQKIGTTSVSVIFMKRVYRKVEEDRGHHLVLYFVSYDQPEWILSHLRQIWTLRNVCLQTTSYNLLTLNNYFFLLLNLCQVIMSWVKYHLLSHSKPHLKKRKKVLQNPRHIEFPISIFYCRKKVQGTSQELIKYSRTWKL